ncbi:glycosyltransferase family 2 protein [Paenibacillus koleovorans]|uniref:glycosyltransferase family 2 protein n=1 Tax=Paenibacillus koleovorans TaxID=121608 RepID=UPI000FDB1094|nr:glycosyltransferase family 2 protein [Paenibacillus koleovorans]
MIRRVRKTSGNKLTAIMQVRNEASRFLPLVLEELCTFVDEIVVVDDHSTDRTAEVCRACPKVVKLVTLEDSLFAQEWELRTLLWQTAAATEPDWLLSVDADELYERKAREYIPHLINQDRVDWFSFRFYDFWGGTTHYRDDALWTLHKRQYISLVRFFPEFPYWYPKKDHHMSRLPPACYMFRGEHTALRVKHLGWAGSLEDRVRKYLRYKKMDPDGRWGSLAQYESILDLEPNLVEWQE